MNQSSSSLFLLLLALVPLVLVSVIVYRVSSDQRSSSWFPFSSVQQIQSGGTVQPSTTTASSSSSSSLIVVEEDKVLPVSSIIFNGSTSLLINTLPKETAPPPTSEKLGLLADEVVHNPSLIRVGYRYKIRRNREKIEAGLARARASIRKAARNRNRTITHQDPDYLPIGPIYRNAYAFHRSYLEMETLFKIFVYEEGEPPFFHNGPCRSIYSSEGRFIHQIEMQNRFRTKDPHKAHVYFLPFSVANMVKLLYVRNSRDRSFIRRTVTDYVSVIASKHPYWNRSLGADHFMLSCHDWGPRTSTYVPELFHNSIRVLCNANTSEGFNLSKDASFPEINLKTGELTGLIGGLSPSRRSILAFFAGRLHGHIRLLLLEQWKNRDQDVQVFESLPNGVSYNEMLKKSRFCLCPSGYEVASPRVVEAIYAECVPVLISDHYVPPFSDVLNWNSFSVQIPVSEIANIKKILMGISHSQYLRMQRRVKQVQKHFVLNGTPKRFDVFHMIVHSIWLRRLNILVHDY